MLGGIALFSLAGIIFLASGLFTPQKAPRRMTLAEESQYDLLTHEGGKVTVFEATGKAVKVKAEVARTSK